MASFKIKQGEVDNGVFEALRLKCVELGYLPDFTAYTNSNAYNAAKTAIKQSGKQIIEVFGVGTGTSKGVENLNNIVIKRASPRPALTGVGIAYEYDLQQNGNFAKSETSDTKFDIEYSITYNTETSEYADIIEKIIYEVFGVRKLINAYNENADVTGQFWLRYKGGADTSIASFIERVVRYDAVNIDLLGGVEMGEVAAVTDINIDGAMVQNPNIPVDDVIDLDNDFSIDIEIEEP